MEELKMKMLSRKSGDILNAADKLYSNIQLKSKEDAGEMEELKLIWELIGSSQVECSQTCSYLIIKLVENAYIPPQPAITHLLSLLSHGMSYDGIVSTIGKLLMIMVERSVESTGIYKCSYGISSNQHPFISVLRSTPATWDLVLDQCMKILTSPSPGLQDSALTLLQPVLYYLYCDPNYHIHFGPIRAVLFKTLIQKSKTSAAWLELLSDLVNWMPVTQRSSFAENCEYILSFLHHLEETGNIKLLKERILLVCSLLVNQIRFGLDTTATLALINHYKDLDLVQDWNVVLVLLSGVLSCVPLGVDEPLLDLAIDLINQNKISKLVAGILVCVLLQSLSFDSKISSSTKKKGDFVRLCQAKVWGEGVPIAPAYVKQDVWDKDVDRALEIVKAATLISTSDSLKINWLKNLSSQKHSALSQFLPLLSSLFLNSSTSEEANLTLKLMLACVKESPSSSSATLTLLLHKLAASSNKAAEPELKLLLLQALPQMAGDRSCVALILKLLGSFAAKPQLTPLRLSLLYKLWRMEPRCFQFLHKALEETSTAESVFTEIQISRAVVIKDIVKTHPGQHGSDLLPIISGILNQSTKPEVTTAATLALESIYIHCKESIIDIRTTVKVISPKCAKDPRSRVLEAYCTILGLAPTFRVSGTEYSNFLSDTLTWLWRTAAAADKPTAVQAAAFAAISNFPLEATTLKMLPVSVRQGLKLPAKYCATPAEAARKPEDVLPYVPCECWPKLLAAANQPKQLIQGIQKLLWALVKTEIDNLPKAVYHLSQAMQNAGAEPVNYNHLPDHSVLRGFMAVLLQYKNQTHPSQNAELSRMSEVCLGLLAEDYGRPLPPFDWLSLDLFLDRSIKPGFIASVSRQAAHSRSARIILERQMSSELDTEAESLYMKELCQLCHSVPPPALNTFVVRSLQKALARCLSEKEECELFKKYLAYVKEALLRANIPEGNLVTLAGCLEGVYDGVPVDMDGYEEYIDTLAVLPSKNIERLSSPALWWEITPSKLFRAASLRTKLALSDITETPLTWLNELLEVAGKQSGDYSFLFRNLVQVLLSARNKSQQACTTWLLELMGQVSGTLRKPGTETVAAFLIDIFILAVVVFTATDTLCIPRDQLCVSRGLRQSMLPSALSRLTASAPGLTGQLADWCLLLTRRNLPNNISECMRSCLPVFKFSQNWNEAFVWGRVVLLAK